jgi:hypothetical protein
MFIILPFQAPFVMQVHYLVTSLLLIGIVTTKSIEIDFIDKVPIFPDKLWNPTNKPKALP